MQFDVSSIADISRIRHIKLAVLIATSDIDATAIQKVKVELLGKGNTKILLNDGPQSTNIIKSGKNANKLYAMMELAPELVQWWASEHINETHTIRLLLSQPFNIRSIAFQRPLLIFYYVPGFQERQQDAEMFQKMKSHARKIRSPHTPPKSCKRCVYAERKIPIADHQPHQSQNHHDQGCILHKWFVNLQDLNWDTMLIAPSGFYANYCSGRCYAPINNLLSNSSYNAVIRSLYNSNNQDGSKTVPAPHCVPTKLKSATFIYTENNGTRINFKELADVEAQECGCR